MYTPKAFEVDEAGTLAFLHSIVAADLVTVASSGLLATYLPVLFDEEGHRFIAHIARNNTQWSDLASPHAMLIAHGDEAYVSPTWYAAKAEHHRVVPTYNYETAHVYGTLRIRDDVEWLRDAVTRLTARHEGHRSPSWSPSDAPADFIDGQLRAIVGLELLVTRVEMKRKMSQNRPDADVPGIVAGLTADGHASAAVLLQRSRPD